MKPLVCFYILMANFIWCTQTLAQGIKTPTTMVLFEQVAAYNNASLLEKNDAFQVGTQGQFGTFSAIRTLYGFGSSSFGNKTTNGLGIAFYSFQEGELIAENRLKISYWKRIELNKHTQLIAGAQAGLINTAYQATRSTAGASTFTPNFDFGVTLKNNNTTISASINQLSNASTTPLTQTSSFKTFYTTLIAQKMNLSETYTVDFYGYYQVIPIISSLIEAKANLSYQEQLQAGVGMGSNGILLSCGIIEIDQELLPLGLYFGYRIPLANSILHTFQPYQLHLSYLFN